MKHARNQGGGSGGLYEPPHAITLVRLVRFSYMYSASLIDPYTPKFSHRSQLLGMY